MFVESMTFEHVAFVTKTKIRLFFGLFFWIASIVFVTEGIIAWTVDWNRPSKLSIIILGWILVGATILYFILNISLCFSSIGKSVFDEFKTSRLYGKIVIFLFWQACLIAYYAVNFALTHYTESGLHLFYFLYYLITMIALVSFGFVYTCVHLQIIREGFREEEEREKNPVKYDKDFQTVTITGCQEGIFVIPFESFAPIHPMYSMLDRKSIYIYLHEPGTPFVKYQILNFDSEDAASLAKESIHCSIRHGF
jgi:hypothetical protein